VASFGASHTSAGACGALDIAPMIAFGIAVTDQTQYERCAAAGIAQVAVPEDLVMTRGGLTLQRAYNAMLDEVSARHDLEAVVLLHQDMRIMSSDFRERIRAILADRTVGLVGVSGAIGSTGLAWWDGAAPVGAFGTDVGGRISTVGVPLGDREQAGADAVDGTLLVLPAWTARQVHFDLGFERDFHGYDTDIAFQVRELGGRVVVANLWCIHERMGKIGARRGAWVRAVAEV